MIDNGMADQIMPNKVNEFQILNADDAELMRISQDGTLSLNLYVERDKVSSLNKKT